MPRSPSITRRRLHPIRERARQGCEGAADATLAGVLVRSRGEVAEGRGDRAVSGLRRHAGPVQAPPRASAPAIVHPSGAPATDSSPLVENLGDLRPPAG